LLHKKNVTLAKLFVCAMMLPACSLYRINLSLTEFGGSRRYQLSVISYHLYGTTFFVAVTTDN
jgi:hypothetical protein